MPAGGANHHAHQVLGEDLLHGRPPLPGQSGGPGPAWMDPAIAPCLRKLAPHGRFVFYGSPHVGLPGS